MSTGWLERKSAAGPGNSCGSTRYRPLKRSRTAQAFRPAAAERPRPVRIAVNPSTAPEQTGEEAGLAPAPRRARRRRLLHESGPFGRRRPAGAAATASSDPLEELFVLGRRVERGRAAGERLGLLRALVLEERRGRLPPRAPRAGCRGARPPSDSPVPGRSSSGSSARPGRARIGTRRCPARSARPRAASRRPGDSPFPRSAPWRAGSSGSRASCEPRGPPWGVSEVSSDGGVASRLWS